ncbi:helix-turn-helix domain-containing protein [Longispora sp. K20-0274]|uniref:helix-turn-helix domain-containing protein n=1 Tax=Longispora sp. K20-0274 TaxID=3088255 RepID=UPI00399A751C
MRITDPRAIRALAHPLRLDLLELLAAGGPATAAHCGRVLGASQASCSFHLRQLAKYGFVEDAGPGADRRERTWRVPETRPTLRIDADGDGLVQRQLERMVIERETRAILDFADRPPDRDPEWRKAGVTTAVVTLTADEAAELRRQWQALLEPFADRACSPPQPGQRHVRYLLAATPLPHPDEKD